MPVEKRAKSLQMAWDAGAMLLLFGLLNQHVWLLIFGTGRDDTYNQEGVGHAGGRTQTSQPPFILEARCDDCAELQFTSGIV